MRELKYWIWLVQSFDILKLNHASILLYIFLNEYLEVRSRDDLM